MPPKKECNSNIVASPIIFKFDQIYIENVNIYYIPNKHNKICQGIYLNSISLFGIINVNIFLYKLNETLDSLAWDGTRLDSFFEHILIALL